VANFNGSGGNDIYTGGADADSIAGNGGNDTLSGNGGNDTIIGGNGADNLSGGDGDDQLFSQGIFPNFNWMASNGVSDDVHTEVDTLSGGAGDDYIFAGDGDMVDGGTHGSYGDRLFISFQGASHGVNADFRPLQSGGSVTIDGGTITNIQNVGYLEGSNYDDTLAAIDTYYPSGADVYGRGGNDYIIADYYSGWPGSGLWGGDGNDTIDATGAGYGPTAHGDAGDDLIRMGSGIGIAYGDGGNDTIYTGGEAHGGAGDDHIILQSSYYTGIVSGDDGNDTIEGVAAGNPNNYGNTISGGAGADVITGTSHSDLLVSGSLVAGKLIPSDDAGLEHDNLSAGAGDDILAIGYGDDADGGDGNDTLSLSLAGATSGVTINVSHITGPTPFSFAGGTIQNIETLDHITGSAFGDTVTVGTQSSLLTIYGGDGGDLVIAGGSSVAFRGEAGNDTFAGGIAGDRFDGGSGFDTADYSQFSSGILATLGATAGAEGSGPGGDVLIAVEQVLGSAFADTLTGSDAGDVLSGNDGHDSVTGNGGNDTLDGGDGNDTLDGGADHDNLYGGNGADVMTGGDGNDHLYGQSAIGGADGADQLNGGAGVDYLQGNAGNDTMDGGAGRDRINGGADNDLITGGDGNDTVNGNLGNDTIDGGADGDSLRGGQGNDQMAGGDGNDTLSGDLGADRLAGGAGADLFRFAAADANAHATSVDEVIDFQHGIDHIALTFVPLAILHGTAADQADAVQTGANLMAAHSGFGEVALIQVGSDTYLVSSGTGNSDSADLAIRLDGVTANQMSLSDFV
jgi:Ca2+-binding RTX toxin-like protein